ncbi:glycosyltransferase family 4 protein [Haladaptatus sp. GCM10025893]|uniref:glycosyltransferase family 4 protein n=1 Tax=Haladaptatus sp. GCM10025893 TaxID=3252659 RepID=UPI0036126EB1
MNVGFITAEYPPKNIGGAGISSKLLVEGLRAHGHSVDVYALTGDGSTLDSHNEGYQELPSGEYGLIPDVIGQNLSVFRHLPDTEQYDVIHVYSPGHLPASILRSETPVVATFVNFSWVCINPERYHCEGLPGYNLFVGMQLARKNQYSRLQSIVAPLVERAGKSLTRRANRITVQTEGMRSILSQCGYERSKIDVVSNILDSRFEIPVTRPNDTPKRLVTVGRFEEEKGIFDIVRAFTELPERVKAGWILEVYGDGSQREEITDFLDKQKEHRVSLDYCHYVDMPEDVYRGASAVVHGAKWPEPFSGFGSKQSLREHLLCALKIRVRDAY